MSGSSSKQCVRITATGGTGAIRVTEHGRREFTPAMRRLIELVARAAYEDMKRAPDASELRSESVTP